VRTRNRKTHLKELIRRILLGVGYEIRHRSIATLDPFRQQGMLLSGVAAPVIFDVGSNLGDIAEKYRYTFPNATIYAFEPFPDIFISLERRLRRDKQVFPFKLALGGTPGMRSLRVNASSPTNSLLDTEVSAASFWGEGLMETTASVDVEVATIDNFCEMRQIVNIDVLKIDTQGTELEVLMGAVGMLSTGRIRVIYAEMIVAPSYKGQGKPHELMGFLDRLGYDLSGLYNLWSRNDGRLLQMDAIFVRRQDVRDPRPSAVIALAESTP
jgi:FkbM family methyltransferase